MNNIEKAKLQEPIEWNGQVVITTAQLAEVYGTTPKNITHNFSRNKDRFKEGKHYICLTGEPLKEFIRVAPERLLPPSTSIAYLWTRRGASRHCKILGTDQAWEQFDYLEDYYFDRTNSQRIPMTLPEQIQVIAKGYVELETKIDNVKKDLEDFKNDMPILGIEETKISNAVKKKGVECLGGKESNAYKDRSLRGKLYSDLHGQLRRQFGAVHTRQSSGTRPIQL